MPTQEKAGETTLTRLSWGDTKLPKECYITVYDYADNGTSYRVRIETEQEDMTGRMFGFTYGTYRGLGERWMEIDPAKVFCNGKRFNVAGAIQDGTTNVCYSDIRILAAEYVAGYVYMAATDGYLYVAEQGDWNNFVAAGRIADGVTIYDMAYNYADGKLYAMCAGNAVYSIDLVTARMTREFTVSIVTTVETATQELMALAIDDGGTFYSVNRGTSTKRGVDCFLYRWNLSQVKDGAITDLAAFPNPNGETYCQGPCTMAWDHDKDILYWVNYYAEKEHYNNNRLCYFDITTGKAYRTNTTYRPEGGGAASAYGSRIADNITGLYIVPSSGQQIGDAGQATGIELNLTQRELLTGSDVQLKANVYPWTLTDKSVRWSSSNPEVATVSETGLVTTLQPGEVVITATTSAEPYLTAGCTFTVKNLPNIAFSGLISDKDGSSYWADFETDHPDQWKAVSPAVSDTYYAGGLLDETIYTYNGSNLVGTNADTFQATVLGGLSTSFMFSDAAPAPANGKYFGRLAAHWQPGHLPGAAQSGGQYGCLLAGQRLAGGSHGGPGLSWLRRLSGLPRGVLLRFDPIRRAVEIYDLQFRRQRRQQFPV